MDQHKRKVHRVATKVQYRMTCPECGKLAVRVTRNDKIMAHLPYNHMGPSWCLASGRHVGKDE